MLCACVRFHFPWIFWKYSFAPSFNVPRNLPQLEVSILVLGATFTIFRFPGPFILIFFEILQMISFYMWETSAQPVNRSCVCMSSNCNIRFIGLNFSICMYCKISNHCGTLCFPALTLSMLFPQHRKRVLTEPSSHWLLTYICEVLPFKIHFQLHQHCISNYICSQMMHSIER